jgi:hypothetical protein
MDKDEFEWLDAANPVAVPGEIYGACIYDTMKEWIDEDQPIARYTTNSKCNFFYVEEFGQ